MAVIACGSGRIGSIPLIVNVYTGINTATVCGAGIAGTLKLYFLTVDLDAVNGQYTCGTHQKLAVCNLKCVELCQIDRICGGHGNCVGTVSGDLCVYIICCVLTPVILVDGQVCDSRTFCCHNCAALCSSTGGAVTGNSEGNFQGIYKESAVGRSIYIIAGEEACNCILNASLCNTAVKMLVISCGGGSIGSVPLIVNINTGRYTGTICGAGVALALKLNLFTVDLNAVNCQHTAGSENGLSVYNLKSIKLYQGLTLFRNHTYGIGSVSGNFCIGPLSIKLAPVGVVDVEVCCSVSKT